MSESVKGSSVSRNTVRESFQRCFVIHGSHNISVSENVAYDTHGHCFLLEDGGEMHNVVTDNLVALTKTGARIRDEETDDTPSSYWITNPQNTFQRQVYIPDPELILIRSLCSNQKCCRWLSRLRILVRNEKRSSLSNQ